MVYAFYIKFIKIHVLVYIYVYSNIYVYTYYICTYIYTRIYVCIYTIYVYTTIHNCSLQVNWRYGRLSSSIHISGKLVEKKPS